MSFKYDFKIQSSIGILSLSGKILSTEKHEELMEFVTDKVMDGHSNVIADLEGLDYINSSGLNLLLKIFTYIRNQGGELVMVNPNKTISELFKISKLNTVFIISADIPSAVKHLNATS